MCKVIIINDFDLTSSIGITFRDYEKAISSYGKLYSLAYSWNNKLYPGTTIYPDLTSKFVGKRIFSDFPFDLGNFINSRLSAFSFHTFRKKILNERREEIIHYSNYRISPFTKDEKSVITMNDLIYTKTNRFRETPIKSFLLRNLKTYMQFKHVHAVSNVVKYELEDYGFDGKIRTIYQPVSSHFKELHIEKKILRLKLGLPLDKVLILSVSTNRPGKNLKALKEMMEMMDSNYHLVRVGSPVGNSINFTNVSDNVLNEIYNACDILIMPSTEEGFGRPIVEAFTTGLPVVASDIPIFEEIAGNAARLVEPKSENLKRAVEETIAETNRFIALGRKRSSVFHYQIFSRDLKKYYESIY